MGKQIKDDFGFVPDEQEDDFGFVPDEQPQAEKKKYLESLL
jgi:hypothetical protein